MRGVLRRAGLRPLTMDMVLTGAGGAALPEFKIAGDRPVSHGDMVLPSLEIAGPGGHWVEVSRAICAGEPSDETKRMIEAYEEYYEAARGVLQDGATAHDAHRAVSKGFTDRGWATRPRHRPLDRDDDDRVPEDRRGSRDRAAERHGALDAPARRSPTTATRVSTCRTRGSSRMTAACRSPTCRCGSSTGTRDEA